MQVVHASASTDRTRRCFFLGVDLGQAHDYTAAVAIERIDTPLDLSTLVPKDFRRTFQVHGIKRLRLGTEYPQQVVEIGELMRKMPVGYRRTELIVDRTGVGRAVYDEFRKSRLRPIGITITAGSAETREEGGWRVAKTELVSVVASALHRRALEIPSDHPLAPVLVRELSEFRANFTDAGHMTFSARQGQHDDLVLATSIALWRAMRFDKDRVISRELLL